jgi:hypothetical protein
MQMRIEPRPAKKIIFALASFASATTAMHQWPGYKLVYQMNRRQLIGSTAVLGRVGI